MDAIILVRNGYQNQETPWSATDIHSLFISYLLVQYKVKMITANLLRPKALPNFWNFRIWNLSMLHEDEILSK